MQTELIEWIFYVFYVFLVTVQITRLPFLLLFLSPSPLPPWEGGESLREPLKRIAHRQAGNPKGHGRYDNSFNTAESRRYVRSTEGMESISRGV